jgi:hypothetical protein
MLYISIEKSAQANENLSAQVNKFNHVMIWAQRTQNMWPKSTEYVAKRFVAEFPAARFYNLKAPVLNKLIFFFFFTLL